jgi:hypothetical protein
MVELIVTVSFVVKDVKLPLSEADWKKEDLKNPRVREEMETLLKTQEGIYGALLDSAWEKAWRDQQVGYLD